MRVSVFEVSLPAAPNIPKKTVFVEFGNKSRLGPGFNQTKGNLNGDQAP